ncbi:TPA: 3-deoxy-7-phosphoheptulonate synthase, partial [Pasteurella multocida]
FIGINQQGQVNLLHTAGNPNGHVILRGGKSPNYEAEHIALCEQELQKAGLTQAIMIDCSHGNSNKDYRLQPKVAKNAVQQIVKGNRSIIGLMLESHLYAGNQSADQPLSEMQYGVSITDACIDWQTTEQLLREMTSALRQK